MKQRKNSSSTYRKEKKVNIMAEYKIYFKDSNIKILSSDNILSIINYLLFELNYNSNDIIKIEKLR